MPRTHEKVTSKLGLYGLTQEVLSCYQDFDEYHYRRTNPGSPHSEMTDLWVRYNDVKPFEAKGDFRGFDDPHDSIWYPIADKLPSVKPVVFDLMRLVEGERLGGILITKLPPGGKIKRHVDGGWHARYYDKFYVPILNKEGATFEFDDGIIAPSLGDTWWFDNSQPHWVENRSDTDRIAMIVCIRTEAYKDKNANRI